MSAIRFTTENREHHLETAAIFTNSGGWREDAIAVAAYDDDSAENSRLRGIFVLQSFDAFGADCHFALAPGRRNTRKLMESLLRFAFHPSWHNLPSLRAYIAADNVEGQLASLHLGFRFFARLPATIASESDAILMVMRREDCRWTLPVTRGHDQREA